MLGFACKHLGAACLKHANRSTPIDRICGKKQLFVNDYFTECLEDVTLQYQMTLHVELQRDTACI